MLFYVLNESKFLLTGGALAALTGAAPAAPTGAAPAAPPADLPNWRILNDQQADDGLVVEVTIGEEENRQDGLQQRGTVISQLWVRAEELKKIASEKSLALVKAQEESSKANSEASKAMKAFELAIRGKCIHTQLVHLLNKRL